MLGAAAGRHGLTLGPFDPGEPAAAVAWTIAPVLLGGLFVGIAAWRRSPIMAVLSVAGLGLAVGPTARASGVPTDVRRTGYAAYDELPVVPIVAAGGDALARVSVRWREIEQSIELCRAALDLLDDAPGPLRVRVPTVFRGEAVARVEAPRGELFYFVAGDGRPQPSRVRVRTPKFANLPAVLRMLPGSQLADVPVILLSIDPCLSCSER